MTAKVGSLGAFWPLLEPVLDALAPRRICEVGVEDGAFAAQLLEWCRPRGCVYVGVDPAPADDVQQLAGLIRGASLEVLPRLEPCDAYFLDGDHNYHTVRGELDAIARGAQRNRDRGPLICVHDVGWPWGRRDMYYAPENIPEQHRHPFSNELGVVLHSEELVDGGLRDPGRYAIAFRAGGARNGVLTAVEDFLARSREAGAAWEIVLVPAAFGLAVLYRRDALPEACAQQVRRLETAAAALGDFLRVLEFNYMSLYLFGEDAKRHAGGLQRHVTSQEKTYADLLEQFNGLQRAYADLSTHSDSLLDEYNRLLESYRSLQNDRGRR
ncbi:MAG TPA: class I SAM-dependent methyltransferase [Xanthomonadales bacterium]|nr:class I SAM-dependent methyltransferase [Xanthomonadales bacterium]